MTYRMKKKYLNPKENQKEVNNFFMEVILNSYADVVDKALSKCYDEYKLYPNHYAIKIMLEMLNKKLNLNVSVEDYDLKNVNRGV